MNTSQQTKKIPEFTTLQALAEHYRHTWEGAGWHVKSEAHSVSLHSFFNNGKPRATPAASLRWIDPDQPDFLAELTDGQYATILPANPRPWRVDADVKKGKSRFGQSYQHLDTAIRAFLAQTFALTPK